MVIGQTSNTENEIRNMKPVLDNLHKIDTKVGETGTTIRKGTKWYDRVQVMDVIDLQETIYRDHGARLGSTIVGEAVITGKLYLHFEDVPAKYIENEHEESSRVYSGLLASMRRAYGDDFSEKSLVTVLIYERTT
jgi:hypothetical protein